RGVLSLARSVVDDGLEHGAGRLAVVVELVAVDRLEPHLRVGQRLRDPRLVLPDERDRDAAVRADLTRAGHEPGREPGALEDALGAHGVLGRAEGNDAAPTQAKLLAAYTAAACPSRPH